MTTPTQTVEYGTEETRAAQALYVALELSGSTWIVLSTSSMGARLRRKSVQARDLQGLERELSRAKERFDLSSSARVISCYEAGRDGFWLHRYLRSLSVDNRVVDSSSIEVPRRQRRAKTDRLDAESLLRLLLRRVGGEERVWREVHVPPVEVEDTRQLQRELRTLKAERTRLRNRMRGLLAAQGVRIPLDRELLLRLDRVRLWDGSPLPEQLRGRLEREWQRVLGVEEQIREVEQQRRELLRQGEGRLVETVQRLRTLRGIGEEGSWVLAVELLGWRDFANRRQVGAVGGLTPMPYSSGGRGQELGISKAGNPQVRALLVELAWLWLRLQPDSALSRWYRERFAHGSSRMRRIGIVAVARKLLIALWKYVTTGVIPEGAQLKSRPA